MPDIKNMGIFGGFFGNNGNNGNNGNRGNAKKTLDAKAEDFLKNMSGDRLVQVDYLPIDTLQRAVDVMSRLERMYDTSRYQATIQGYKDAWERRMRQKP